MYQNNILLILYFLAARALNQEFYVNMNLKNTETLSRLLLPNLTVSENTVLTATFTSNNYQLHSTLESDEITYNGVIFSDVYVKNKTEKDKTTLNINLKDFIFKQKSPTNPVELGLENMKFYFDLHDDSLLFDLSWDDALLDDVNKGKLSMMAISLRHIGNNCTDSILRRLRQMVIKP